MLCRTRFFLDAIDSLVSIAPALAYRHRKHLLYHPRVSRHIITIQGL